MEKELVLATWGLVLATFLLFLASSVPAVGQFREWRDRRRALASTLVPRLHGIRGHVVEARDELLKLRGNEGREEFARVYYAIEDTCAEASHIGDMHGVTIEQRLEAYVLGSHLNLLGLQLSLLGSGDDEVYDSANEAMPPGERLRSAINHAQAALLSLDRMDQLLVAVRKKFKGRTFTEQMMYQTRLDNKEAEKLLVDIREARKSARE